MRFLVLANFVTSIFGELAGCMMLCCAFAASAASSEDRTLVIVMVVAATDTGFGIGSLIGNYLQRYFGFPSVFIFATTVLIVSLLYLVTLVPNTDHINEPSKGEQYGVWNYLIVHMKETWFHLLSFVKIRLLHSKDNTNLLLLIAAFFNYASHGGERALVTFFLEHSPLNLKADKIGIYLVLTSFSRAFGLIVLAFFN